MSTECDPTKGSGEVFCIGNALLDITYFADTAFIEAQELNPSDTCVIDDVDRFKTILGGLESRFRASGHVPGGSGQNVARTIQWCLPGEPGSVTYMGALCDDEFGSILKEKANHAGINCVYETIDMPTGCCLVLISGEHNECRSLAAHLGGAKKFTVEHLKQNWQLVEKAKTFYIEGFFLPTCYEACQLLGKYVSGEENKRLALNLSAPYITTEHRDKLMELMPCIDLLFGNETEFASFGRAIGCGDDLETVVSSVAKMPKATSNKRVVVCTQGANPVIVGIGNEIITTYDVQQLPEDRIVDCNGAGDAFVGGFLANLHRRDGQSIAECVRCGVNVAAITLQRLGCTFPAEKPCMDKLSA